MLDGETFLFEKHRNIRVPGSYFPSDIDSIYEISGKGLRDNKSKRPCDASQCCRSDVGEGIYGGRDWRKLSAIENLPHLKRKTWHTDQIDFFPFPYLFSVYLPIAIFWRGGLGAVNNSLNYPYVNDS